MPERKDFRRRAIGTAVGLFLANAVLIPVLADEPYSRGIIVGAIAGALVIVGYEIVWFLRAKRSPGS